MKNIFKNKKITVMGLGLLGRGLNDAKYLAEKGAEVTVTDLKKEEDLKSSLEVLKGLPIKYVLGRHEEKDFINCDFVLRNAGVPRDSKYLQIARDNNIPIEMDESLFCKNNNSIIIGITGTRGKTTTTLLLYEILKQILNKKVFLGGNVQGHATLPLLDQARKEDIVVMELSSWQLQGFDEAKISPNISVFTNIYPDHLNRYKDMSEYISDKKAIYKYQKENDYLFLNEDDKLVKSFEKEAVSQVGMFNKNNVPKNWNIKLLGEHNLENIAAALSVLTVFNIEDEECREIIENFSGLEHRLEYVDTINSVEFYNDTASTTPVACQKALASFKKPIILIAGGADKNLDVQEVAKDIKDKVKKIVLLQGKGTDKLVQALKKYDTKDLIADNFDDFSKAVEKAFTFASPGDVVLLSPAFSSFNMFVNEYERGNIFKKIVQKLKNKLNK